MTDENGNVDINAMIAATAEYIKQGRDNICEASFNFNGLYCAVDILRKHENGYAIYEVKSSTHESAVCRNRSSRQQARPDRSAGA